MALRRSDSVKTTLTMYITRSSKYQRWISTLSVFVLLGSLSLIFFGLVLKFSYIMDHLDFISWAFAVFPWLLISIGMFTFLTAMGGFIFSATEQRPLLITYAVCMFLLCVGQLTSVFLANEIRNTIDRNEFSEMNNALTGYPGNESIRLQWDYIQQKVRCCGINDFNDFAPVKKQIGMCVPDSCCLNTGCNPNCESYRTLIGEVFTLGCRETLHKMYRDDLEWAMILYGILGTILGMMEIIAAALGLALSAHISRRMKRENSMWAPGEDVTAGHNMESFNHQG